MAARAHPLALEMDVDVIPMVEIADDRIVRLGIGGAKALHGLVRKHHTPAESVVRAVAFIDLDTGARQRFLEQDGGIQARRPAAQTYDALHGRCATGTR